MAAGGHEHRSSQCSRLVRATSDSGRMRHYSGSTLSRQLLACASHERQRRPNAAGVLNSANFDGALGARWRSRPQHRNRTHAVQQVSYSQSPHQLRRAVREEYSEAERIGVTHFSRDAISPHERVSVPVPERSRQFLLVRIYHEYREELGRLRLAGIGTDAMAVAG